MTTGRINQVAFLTDADVARGRRARGDVTSRSDDGSRSMRAIDAEFGQIRGRGPPALPVFRVRELRLQSVGRDASLGCDPEHGLAFAVHPAPRPQIGGTTLGER